MGGTALVIDGGATDCMVVRGRGAGWVLRLIGAAANDRPAPGRALGWATSDDADPENILFLWGLRIRCESVEGVLESSDSTALHRKL